MNYRNEKRYPKLTMKEIEKHIKDGINIMDLTYNNDLYFMVYIDKEKQTLYLNRKRIFLDATPCNYGGGRLWFRCPHCGNRKGALYHYQSSKKQFETWACRDCLNLVYKSQQMTKTDYWTWYLKAQDVARKIDPDYEVKEYYPAFTGLFWHHFPNKPKYMKWAKYERIRSKFIEYADTGNRLSFQKIQSILKMADRHQR